MNIIPLGDHCAPAMILKDLGYRNSSYPFDWFCYNSNNPSDSVIEFNIDLLLELLDNNNINEIVHKLLGNKIDSKNKINNNLLIPHEEGTIEETNNKYIRRFTKLYKNIINENCNLFIIVLRCHEINYSKLVNLSNAITKYNINNKILLITGIDNTKEINMLNLPNLHYKFIYYNKVKAWDEDYTSFRPKIKEFLNEYLKKYLNNF